MRALSPMQLRFGTCTTVIQADKPARVSVIQFRYTKAYNVINVSDMQFLVEDEAKAL